MADQAGKTKLVEGLNASQSAEIAKAIVHEKNLGHTQDELVHAVIPTRVYPDEMFTLFRFWRRWLDYKQVQTGHSRGRLRGWIIGLAATLLLITNLFPFWMVDMPVWLRIMVLPLTAIVGFLFIHRFHNKGF